MDLQEEFRLYEKSRPETIYLEHCKTYAKQYLEESKIGIENYEFTIEDVEKGVISNKLMEILRLQEADQTQSQITNEDFTEMFKTESLKIFTDIIYYQQKHILCVKTWQKVSFSCKLKNSSHPVTYGKLINNKMNMAVKNRSVVLNRVANSFYEKEEIASFEEMVKSSEVI